MIHRARFHLREALRVQAGGPAVLLGVRTAIATLLPQIAAPYIGIAAATYASLAGFVVALVDKGGAYRTRASTTGAVAVGGALCVFIGSAASTFPVASLVVMLLGVTAAMFMGAFGPSGTSVGNSLAVQLAVALALPIEPNRAWIRALAFLAGGLFAMFISIVLWPIRVYAPVRRSVAVVLRRIGNHARDLGQRTDIGTIDWRANLSSQHRIERDSIELARASLAATRRGRRGESGRGARLLMVVQLCDRILGTFVALEDVIETTGQNPSHELERLADAMIVLADAVVVEDAQPSVPREPVFEDRESIVSRLIERAFTDAITAAHVIQNLANENADLPPIEMIEPTQRQSILETIRVAFDPNAVIFRHAIRVGVVATIAALLGDLTGWRNSYWVTLTAILLLQPYLPATVTKGVQRIGGTIVGGIVAALLASTLHSSVALLIVVGFFAAVTAAVLQLNYGLFSLFLTPTFILLAESHAPDPTLVKLRIINTLIGGALALTGALLLWPAREGTRFAAQLANAIEVVHQYFLVALTRSSTPSAIAAARRQVGLAFNNADLSFERVLAESARPSPQIEAYMTLLLYGRRLTSAITALAAVDVPHVDREQTEAIDRGFTSLVTAVRDRSQPTPFVPTAELPRISEQLSTMYQAAGRLAS